MKRLPGPLASDERKAANPSFYEEEALKLLHTPERARQLFKAGTRGDLLKVAGWASIKAASRYAKGIGGRRAIQWGRRRSGHFKDARESFYALALQAAYYGVDCWRAKADNRTPKLAKLARVRRSLPGFERYIFAAVDYILGQLSVEQHAHGPGFGLPGAYASGRYVYDGEVKSADPDVQLAMLIHHRGLLEHPTGPDEPQDLRADARTLERFKAQEGERTLNLAIAVRPYTQVSQARYVASSRRRKDYKTDEDYQRAREEFAAELRNACDLLHVFANWGEPTIDGRPLPPSLRFWVDFLQDAGRYSLRPGARFPKGDAVRTPEGQDVLLTLYRDLLPTLQKIRERGKG